MMRKLALASVVTLSLVAGAGVSPAGAITLPAGDGSVQCGIGGTVKVLRPTRTPDIVKVVAVGQIAGCTYNGNAIPFAVSGATRTVAVSSPAAVCAALADGTASARTSVTIKVNGSRYASVAINVAVDVVPSAPGSLVTVDGTATVNGIALTGNVTAQTARPLADLCNGATSVSFLGTASLDWDRP